MSIHTTVKVYLSTRGLFQLLPTQSEPQASSTAHALVPMAHSWNINVQFPENSAIWSSSEQTVFSTRMPSLLTGLMCTWTSRFRWTFKLRYSDISFKKPFLSHLWVISPASLSSLYFHKFLFQYHMKCNSCIPCSASLLNHKDGDFVSLILHSHV